MRGGLWAVVMIISFFKIAQPSIIVYCERDNGCLKNNSSMMCEKYKTATNGIV